MKYSCKTHLMTFCFVRGILLQSHSAAWYQRKGNGGLNQRRNQESYPWKLITWINSCVRNEQHSWILPGEDWLDEVRNILRDIEADKKCVLSLNMSSLISPWIEHHNWCLNRVWIWKSIGCQVKEIGISVFIISKERLIILLHHVIFQSKFHIVRVILGC